MAYSRGREPQCNIPADPGWLWTHIPMTTAEVNVPVYVPWNNVKLAYAYSVYTGNDVAGGTLTQDWEIDLELDVAGGTELMSITISSASAIGTVDEATFSDERACAGLSDKSTIMIESDASDDTVGAANIYMYFEQV